MLYLSKKEESKILAENLRYSTANDRLKIKQYLIDEQYGFCAYSERYFCQTDEAHIEHFDGRKKSTEDDNYYNWYATHVWFNTHKPKKIEPFLPITSPNSNLEGKIKYVDNIFVPSDNNDTETKNLLDYLGVNKRELYTDRVKHVSRVRELRNLCSGDEELFKKTLLKDLQYLSFGTALTVNLAIDVKALIQIVLSSKTAGQVQNLI